MGTRSTIKIYDEVRLILSLYKQFDGYIEGLGNDLKKFIKSKTFINGFNEDNAETSFNGIGCFALQLVCKFKDGIGGLYATSEGDIQEFNYIIRYIYAKNKKEKNKIIIECEEREDFKEVIEVA